MSDIKKLPQPLINDEILISEESELQSKELIIKAKERELQSWINREVYNEVDDTGQQKITTKWVMTKKEIEGKPGIKARLVARGYEDEDNDIVRSDSPTVSREGIRFTLAIITTNSWDIKSMDISTAFLQGRPIKRTIYIKPPKEAKTKKIWHLRKCVYGLNDANREWYLRIKNELTDNGCTASSLDHGLFVWYHENELGGILAVHVDDILYGGSELFNQQLINKVRDTFTIGAESQEAFKYLGVCMKQKDDHEIIIDQNPYSSTLTPITLPKERERMKKDETNLEEKDEMKSKIGQLSWLAGITRPDISYRVCQMSTQIKSSTVNDILKLNKIIRDVKSYESRIRIPKFKSMSYNLLVYADASFCNLPDGRSQGGFIILLSDGTNVCPISWRSLKIKRVVRSTIAAETLALADACECAIFWQRVFNEALNTNSIQIYCYSDNKSLVESSKTTNRIQDTRLQLEMSAVREMIEKKEITLSWIEGDKQLGNCLTKFGASSKELLEVLQEARINM